MTSNVFPVSYIEPCFLLSSLRLVFHIGFFSIPYSLFTAIISISLSLHLVLLASVNSCELHNYHLVLSFLFMYSSSGLSTDVFFPNKTNINTHILHTKTETTPITTLQVGRIQQTTCQYLHICL